MNSTRFPSETPILTLTGVCPCCESALVLRQSKRDQRNYIGCSAYPTCLYRSHYDEVLHQLRDQVARTEAEKALLRLQAQPVVPHTLIQRSLVDSKLTRLGNLLVRLLRQQGAAPDLVAEMLKAILALQKQIGG